MGEHRIPAVRWFGAMALLGCFLVSLNTLTIASQENATVTEPAASGEGKITQEARYTEVRGFFDWFQRGGNFMYPLLLSSIIGVAVVIERAVSLRRATASTRGLIRSVLHTVREQGIEAGRAHCRAVKGPAARILDSGLAQAREGSIRAERAMESTGSIEVALLQRGLLALSTVANVTPLLGFLGTVSGMIHAFATIAGADQISARLVAGGIEEALITTETGLAIAIPIQAFHNYFVGRIDRFSTEMEEGSVILIQTLEEADQG